MKRSALIVSLLAAVYLVMFFVLALSPQSGNADSISPEKLSEGLVLWRSHNCAVCHSIYGLGGHMGPDLTNVISRRGEDYVRYIVRNGGYIMPRFKISADGMNKLLSYLDHVNLSGSYPPESLSASGFGGF